MRKLFSILNIVLAYFNSEAQLYDAQWVLAPNPSVVDFRNNSVTNGLISSFFSMTLTDANICDSSGDLLYITNGINLYDINGDSLVNGNGLSPCPYTDLYAQVGLNIPQGALFIPAPGKANLFYLFHMSNDTLNMGRPGTLYYTLIDGTNGYGLVLQKNIPFCKGIFTEGGMTGCKHANGRDYWIIKGSHASNTYYKFLITADTILGPFLQSIGPAYLGPYDNIYSKFSQDGSKYGTGAFVGLVTVMDFDRCTGEFSNAVTIYNNASNDPIHNPLSGSASLEFSPIGRFVYVANRTNLTQYDLWAANIQDSVELYKADTSDHAQISSLQLAPNGKIYGSTWNGGFYFMHVINQPNEKGDSCKFVRGGYTTLTEDDFSLPNMINYKLGPLVGSSCDTLNTSVKQEIITDRIRIQPNPADKYVYVEMGNQGNYEMQLLNEMGQLIDKKETRQVDIFDTEKLAAGIYFIKTIDKATLNEVVTQKIIVAH